LDVSFEMEDLTRRTGELTDRFERRSETDHKSTGQHGIAAFGKRLDNRTDDDEERANG
jgi:hypothetical protein